MATQSTVPQDIESKIRDVLRYLGEDPDREGLVDTPRRIVSSWTELYAGYHEDPVETLSRVFTDDPYDQMVVLKDCEFYSTCEHHMLPFFGKVHVGYIPAGKLVGVSKLARIVEVFSRRLQIQERMTSQIATTINNVLSPVGVIVIVEAQHFCMTARGVEKQNSIMVTSEVTGAFKEQIAARQEFFSLIRR